MLRRFDPSETQGTEQIEEAAFYPRFQPKPARAVLSKCKTDNHHNPTCRCRLMNPETATPKQRT
jgi:hypothetical protein